MLWELFSQRFPGESDTILIDRDETGVALTSFVFFHSYHICQKYDSSIDVVYLKWNGTLNGYR